MNEQNFGKVDGGPVHRETSLAWAWGQAWCGVRRQYRHRTTDRAVTCPKCLRALKRGKPYSRRSR